MNLKSIFDGFARRNASSTIEPVTETFRNRAFMLLQGQLSGENVDQRGRLDDYRQEFWHSLYQRLTVKTGRFQLSPTGTANALEDIVRYFFSCPAAEFFHLIEQVFQVPCYMRACGSDEHSLINDINTCFDEDLLPYQLTRFVWNEERGAYGIVSSIISYPQVITRESEAIHQASIAPTLLLLADPSLRFANIEFLAALADYRNGDYLDCAAKCGKALESTLKVICEKRKWRYQDKDTTPTLLRIFFERTGLDATVFEPPLKAIANMRNYAAHGAGAQPRAVSKPIARFAVNATAAAILFLTDEALG